MVTVFSMVSQESRDSTLPRSVNWPSTGILVAAGYEIQINSWCQVVNLAFGRHTMASIRTHWKHVVAVVALLIAALGIVVSTGRAFVADRTPDWIAMLKDPNPDVRRHGALQLNELAPATPEVLDALMRALTDESVGVRQQAAHGLGKFGRDARQAVPLLNQALNDQDVTVRKNAAESLRRISGK